MPSRKSSPSKAKKSPKARSKSRSRSRSRSTARKTPARSRSRSSARKAKSAPAAVEIQKKSPARPSRKSPSRPKTPPRIQKEAEIVPTRVTRRVEEKTTYQQVSRSTVSDKGDGGVKTRSMTTTTTTTVKQQSGGVQTGTGPGWTAIILIPFVIILTYMLILCCDKTQCSVFKIPTIPRKWQTYLDLEAAGIILAFHALVLILYMIPVGQVVTSQPMRDGSRLNYRCNGWLTLVVMAGCFGYAIQRDCPMTYVHEHLIQLVTASMILCMVLSVVFYIWGRNSPRITWCPGADGTFLNDFWTGRVLHPRCGDVVLKSYLFRCAMLLWMLIDWMYLAASFKTNQKFDPALVTLVLFHTLYVLFCIKNEHTFLSANDFMIEGVGFMFLWAILAFTPFILIQQTRYLYMYPQNGLTNKYALGALTIFDVVGLMFFIGANWQKNEFRRNPYNPELSHLSSIPTATGKRLLTSGWYGIVRRPNYLGDLMMAVAWSIPCGCTHALPYIYPIYLVILLVFRTINDEKSCKQRYGEAWDKYTKIVPYRLIPYVF